MKPHFNGREKPGYILIDAHAHTRAISTCSQRTAEEIVAQCLYDGTDGIVLTNHCKAVYLANGESWEAWRARYVAEYYHAKAVGDAHGVRVFFGVEVTPASKTNLDFLIYGIRPEQMLAAPPLFAMDQKALFGYCEENGFLFFQAHPYRNGATPQDPACLHGVEINCHPLYGSSEEEKVRAFATANGLRLSCGADYHGDTYKPRCGDFVPAGISDGVAFAEYLRREDCEMLIAPIITA